MHRVLWSARGKRTGKEETKMSAEENKAVVRREQEVLWNHTGDLDATKELYAAGQAEAAKQEAANFRQGFPDVTSTIEDLIAEGDKVGGSLEEPRHPSGGIYGHRSDRQ
jgi:predicted ester cyclase